MSDLTITTPELSALTGLPAASLYRVARQGLAPKGTAVFLGRRVWWRRRAAVAWIEAGGSRLTGGSSREPAGTEA